MTTLLVIGNARQLDNRHPKVSSKQ